MRTEIVQPKKEDKRVLSWNEIEKKRLSMKNCLSSVVICHTRRKRTQ
jgi:hypothetical protein